MTTKLTNLPPFLWLNIDRAKDRYNHMTELFNKFNVNNIRIKGIDGNDKSIEENEILLKKFGYPYFITLSHLNIFKYYIDNKETIGEYCIICEDDLSFQLVEYWDKSLNEYIDELPEDWEIFKCYSGNHINTQTINYNEKKSYGSVLYIIKYNAAKKIIDLYNNINIKDLSYVDFLNYIIDVFIFKHCITYVKPLFIYELFPSMSNLSNSYNDELISIYKHNINLWKCETREPNNLIPKIIHQIWLGDKIKPDFCLNSWKEKHPDYEYILWTEDEIKKRNMVFECDTQIRQNKEFCGKADIMRYEILYKYGGVYIDADTYCIENIDELLTQEHLHYENEQERPGLIANGFIFVKPYNSLMRECIDRIKKEDDINREPPFKITGPFLLTDIVKQNNSTIDILPSYIFLPYHYTNNIYKGSNKIYGFHYWGSTSFTKFNYDSNKLHFPSIILDNMDKINNNLMRIIANMIEL